MSTSPSAAPAPSPAKTKTALVIDDFPSVRFYHANLLGRIGFNCFMATNGREALALLHTQPVDLLVLDLVMPEMTGEELIKTLHASTSLAHIPVLVISSEGLGARIRQSRTPTAGPIGFVRKPLLPAAIFAEIAELMR